MVRNGKFCIYKGIEYKINRNLLITKDKNKIDVSFIDEYNSGVYTKVVDEGEVEEIYNIHTFGQIGDLKVNVEKELEDYYLVGTSNLEIAQKVGLERCDKYYHEGKILKKDIIITEEKIKIK